MDGILAKEVMTLVREVTSLSSEVVGLKEREDNRAEVMPEILTALNKLSEAHVALKARVDQAIAAQAKAQREVDATLARLHSVSQGPVDSDPDTKH